MISTRLYSYPPSCTKKPFGPCTLAIATAIVASTSRPASGVSSPSRNRAPAISSPPTASPAQNLAGRNPMLPMNPAAPSNPGPPNAPNDFCAPCARNTAPSTSRRASNPRSVNIRHLTDIVSKSKYFTSNQIGNNFPGREVPGGNETFAERCVRAPEALGGAGPGVRRRRTPLAGEHRPLRVRHDRVRGAGGAVPQGRAAGVRSATPHPGRVVEHHLRGGQARETRPGASTSQQGRPPGGPAGADARGTAVDPGDLSNARRRDAAGRRRIAAARAGPGCPVAARARAGRGQAAGGRRGRLEPLPEPQP